jgi:hypothetical protein
MRGGWKERRIHLIVLAASISVLALGALLQTDGERVFVDGTALPSVCWWRNTPLEGCPGCGLTRSIVLICHLHWQLGVAIHPAGPLMVLLLVLEIPYRLVLLRKIHTRYLHAVGKVSERILLAMVLWISLAAWT